MRRLVLVVLAAGMIWIPSSAHATTCIWSLPGPGYRSPYDAVFVGTILEKRTHTGPCFGSTRSSKDGSSEL